MGRRTPASGAGGKRVAIHKARGHRSALDEMWLAFVSAQPVAARWHGILLLRPDYRFDAGSVRGRAAHGSARADASRPTLLRARRHGKTQSPPADESALARSQAGAARADRRRSRREPNDVGADPRSLLHD